MRQDTKKVVLVWTRINGVTTILRG